MMGRIYTQVGRKIRDTRKKQGLTQAELGERAAITPDYLGRVERGQGAVTLETLAGIAAALAVPLRQLLDTEEIASASRDEVLKSIQGILKQKDLDELRKIWAILEVL